MRVGNGIEMLEISAMVVGEVRVIHPTVIWDDQNLILVDTAHPGQLPLIREALQKANLSLERLSKIIITHQDIDHIGTLPNLLNESSQTIEVLANAVEKPFIQGEKRLIKISTEAIARAIASLPAEVPEQMRKAFRSALENPPKGNVDKVVEDGEVLPYCGGIVVINTPGHTPGHISLYHVPSKTLIVGDAMVVVDGQLSLPDPQSTLDMNLAKESLRKFTTYDIETVICYHGGLYTDNVNERILELVSL